MRLSRTPLHSIVLAAVLTGGMTAVGASLALAQSSKPSATQSQSAPQSSQPQPGAPSAAAAFSEQELKTFAVAALEVKKINDNYRSRYQSADTPEAKQQVQKEATDKMAAAVQDKGLSVDKYNLIVRAAQTDPQVAQQIDDYAKQSK